MRERDLPLLVREGEPDLGRPGTESLDRLADLSVEVCARRVSIDVGTTRGRREDLADGRLPAPRGSDEDSLLGLLVHARSMGERARGGQGGRW